MTQDDSPVPDEGRLRWDHIGISVRDLGVARDWWCRALNLELEYRVEPPGTDLRGVMLVHPTGFRIELLHRPGATASQSAAGPLEAAAVLGLGHVCLRVEDVPAAYDALLERGATARKPPSISPARPGALNAFVSDPDGNLIEILDRPGS
jgi:catechol 2,3-dioxygenase-like lactoylglutathione lyase family enzyme